jgi:hypothetical protein
MSETKPKKMVRRSVAIALGIICIVLVGGFGGAVLYTVTLLNDKDKQIASLNAQISKENNTISSLNSQISQLNSNVTNLQNQVASDNSTIRFLTSNVTILQKVLNDLLNGTATLVGLDELTRSYRNWVNRTVVVEGNLSGWFGYFPEDMPPWNYEWVNPDGTLNDYFGVFWGGGNFFNSTNVIVVGVVREGELELNGDFLPAYFIEAERIILS